MKEKLKKFGLYFGLAIVGVVVGTVASIPVNGIAFSEVTVSDFILALVLAPFEMTIGFSPLFEFFGGLVGTLALAGMFLCVGSAICAFKCSNGWTKLGVLVGSTLWSLGNVAVFFAFMSV